MAGEQVRCHEMVIAQKCIKLLNSMKYGSKDNRPKTKQALQNVLMKETKLLYVSSALSILYKYPYSVSFYECEDIFMSDNQGISSFVASRCKAKGRRVFVLTCDSALYPNIESQIEKWFDQEECLIQRGNLIHVHAIPRVLYLDHALSARDLYNKLVELEYITERDDSEVVTLHLPDEVCLNALETSLNEWEAGKEIVVSKAYASVAENGYNVMNLQSETVETFPPSLPLEVAYVLVHLGKLKQVKPTSNDIIGQIESTCKTAFLMSPKSTSQNEATMFDNGDHIGTAATAVLKDVSEITQLALLLSFQGQLKIFKRCNNQLKRLKYRRSYSSNHERDWISVSMDDINALLDGFQRHIFKHSNERAERQRATIILNDPHAETRCRERLFKYLDEVNEKHNSLTETEFSKKLVECSYEIDTLPCDMVVQKLIDLEYLVLSNEMVEYKEPKTTPEITSDNEGIHKFLRRWETDQAPRDNHKPSEGRLSVKSNLGRKRPFTLQECGIKKAKRLIQ